jgi:predicted Zn-dependent protease
MMVSRINKLLAAVVLISITLYIVLSNREYAQVYLSEGHQYSAPLGVILIATFILGTLASTAVAAFFGVRTAIRERARKRGEKRREQREQLYIEARSLRLSGNYTRSRRILEQLLRQDGDNIIVLIELVKVLQDVGENSEAIRLISEYRTENGTNTELIFLAAELHQRAGNRTAALDNYDLLLRSQINEFVLRQAMALAEELERFPDALVYLDKLRALGTDDRQSAARIKFKQLLKTHSDGTFPYREMRSLTRTYPEFGPAWRILAQEEENRNNLKASAQFLIKAAKAEGTFLAWKPLTDLWIRHNSPQNAVAASKTAVQNLSGDDQIAAVLMLARVYLRHSMAEEASKVLDSLKEKAHEVTTPALLRELVLLRAAAYSALGVREKFQESLSLLDGNVIKIEKVLPAPVEVVDDTSEIDEAGIHSPALSVP